MPKTHEKKEAQDPPHETSDGSNSLDDSNYDAPARGSSLPVPFTAGELCGATAHAKPQQETATPTSLSDGQLCQKKTARSGSDFQPEASPNQGREHGQHLAENRDSSNTAGAQQAGQLVHSLRRVVVGHILLVVSNPGDCDFLLIVSDCD